MWAASPSTRRFPEAANASSRAKKVQIMDIDNGERFETYVIKGERGSGCICLNGAAARKVQVGDVIIIASYALMDFEDAKQFGRPWIVFPDTATNRLVKSPLHRPARRSTVISKVKSPVSGRFFAINAYLC